MWPLGLSEVLAEVDEGNAASVAVIGRLGMTPFEVVPTRPARPDDPLPHNALTPAANPVCSCHPIHII